MKRRGFLAGAAALAAGALDPFGPFARRAHGDVSLRAPRESALDAAIRRARRSGHPLLALVIPREYADKLERGHAFGEWLTHGSDADLAPLARCELTCATSEELERTFGWSAAGEPLLAFVEYDRAPVLPQRLTARLPPVPQLCLWCMDQSQSERLADAVIDERIALLGGWVRGRVERREPGFTADAARVAELATEARAELRAHPPSGGRWAYAEQFGAARLDVEPPPRGDLEFIAKRTQRVLYLFDD